ncbi:transmembrane protein 71 isoform 1-T1 [Synchiropus picturatus]
MESLLLTFSSAVRFSNPLHHDQLRMDLFFSGATTSSPVKRRRTRHTCRSLDESLLSPDSSYVCYPADGGESCCCRRSPRLLTNGYYDVNDDSFLWDDHGNVSLTPCKSNVSYKENLVRIFRRRRRHRGSLANLLSEVTESCQSWLGQSVFRGVFGTGPVKEPDQVPAQGSDPSPEGCTTLDDSVWNSTFTYDAYEAPPPSDKPAPPHQLVQEEISSETCQSQDPDQRFNLSPAGLAEVPPPTAFHPCSRPPPSGSTTKTLLLLFLVLFLASAAVFISSWTSFVALGTATAVTASSLWWRSGRREWRRAKTEDITSRNE